MKKLLSALLFAALASSCAPSTTAGLKAALTVDVNKIAQEIDGYQPKVVFSNAQGVYVVVVEPVTDTLQARLDTLNPDVEYQAIFSKSGYATATVPFKLGGNPALSANTALPVGGTAALNITVPALAPVSAEQSRAANVFFATIDLSNYDVNNYYLLIRDEQGNTLQDLAKLGIGNYEWVLSRAGHTAAPTGFLAVQSAPQQLQFPSVNAFKELALRNAAAPVTTTFTKGTTTPSAAPSSSGGLCYVNGYTRRNGTYVSGYYRRC